MNEHLNSQPKLNHDRQDTKEEQPPSMEETTEQARQRHIDESLEKAGFKRGALQGASHYVGTQPAGNIRFNRSTKKSKTTSHDSDDEQNIGFRNEGSLDRSFSS
jgi:hypothetical protein